MKHHESESAPKAMERCGPVVLIERLVPGGNGFAKLDDGRALMVPGALPGDRVQLAGQTRKAGVQYADGWHLLEPGPDRIEPVCEVQPSCGGCDLMPLNQVAQTRAKLELLRDALLRVGGLAEHLAPSELVSPGPTLGYRSRLRLHVQNDRLGFFQRSTRRLVEPKRCHVAVPQIQEAFNTLRRAARKHPGALNAFDWLEVRVSVSGTGLFFQLSKQHRWVPAASEALLRSLRREFLVATNSDKQQAEWERFELFEDVYMYAAPGGFTQVNWLVNRVLIERVVALAMRAGLADFMDLYCGSGNFSLPLLKAGLRGVGIESSQSAILAAKQAAREQELPGRFVADDAAGYLRRALAESRKVDLIILDPPRAGVKEALGAVTQVARRHICMVSCEPVTLARDLKALGEAGFRLESLEAFDMFPQTHHVECLVWLARS